METDAQEDKRTDVKHGTAEEVAEGKAGKHPAMMDQQAKMMKEVNRNSGKPAQMKMTEAACKKAPYSRGC